MGFGDLAGDRQAEAGILAEILAFRPVGVEALKDAVDVFRLDAGAVVLDIDEAAATRPRQAQDDAAALPRARRSGHSR